MMWYMFMYFVFDHDQFKKARKSTVTSSQIEIHFSIQTTKFLNKYVLCFVS